MSRHDPLTELERALARQLRDDPNAEPSAQLDASILAQARAAVVTTPVHRRHRRRPYLVGLASAAVLVLCVGVVLRVVEQTPQSEAPSRAMEPEVRAAPSAPSSEAPAAQIGLVPLQAVEPEPDLDRIEVTGSRIRRSVQPSDVPAQVESSPQRERLETPARSAQGERPPPPSEAAPAAAASDIAPLRAPAPAAATLPEAASQRRVAPADTHIDRMRIDSEVAASSEDGRASLAAQADSAWEAATGDEAIAAIRRLITAGDLVAARVQISRLRLAEPGIELPADLVAVEQAGSRDE